MGPGVVAIGAKGRTELQYLSLRAIYLEVALGAGVTKDWRVLIDHPKNGAEIRCLDHVFGAIGRCTADPAWTCVHET